MAELQTGRMETLLPAPTLLPLVVVVREQPVLYRVLVVAVILLPLVWLAAPVAAVIVQPDLGNLVLVVELVDWVVPLPAVLQVAPAAAAVDMQAEQAGRKQLMWVQAA